ncbi:MAG: glucose-1-phosphate adenylyltransferase subunit GlgD [Christensenellales bacterium]|jgi:glucose-1-phosphate adenylyltransferase
MIKEAFGLIYTGENTFRLRELTNSRSVAAVPFGGRYRIIDFMMSNLVNSGVRSVGLICQRNYHSLMDHLGSGKEWDLHRKRDGLFINPPFVTKDNTGNYRGTADAIMGVMGFIRRNTQRYCIMMGSHTVYNSTFNELLKFHKEKRADITIMYNFEPDQKYYDELYEDVHLFTREDGRVYDMEINPAHASSARLGMDVFIIDKELLEYLVQDSIARANYDFMRDIVLKRLDELRVYGFEYKGHVARIDSVLTYYKHSMQLLEEKVRQELFFRDGSIFTKVKDEVPARYGENALAKNSMLADGCIIEGEIENCMLFRGVHVAKGAKIKNSILMQESVVQENAVLNHVILDKNVLIKRDRVLVGQEDFPVIIRKNAIV